MRAGAAAAAEAEVVNPDARGTRGTRDADRAAVASLTSGREAVYFAEGRMECEAGQYRLQHLGLQPSAHTVAACITYGCSLHYIRLQAGQYRRAAELLELAYSVSGSAVTQP